MGHLALGFCQSLKRMGETKEATASDRLHADAFHEVRGREASASVRPTASWQNMIAPAGVVSDWLSCPRAEKDSPRTANFLQGGLRIFRKAQMLGCKPINEFARMLERIGDENRPGSFCR